MSNGREDNLGRLRGSLNLYLSYIFFSLVYTRGRGKEEVRGGREEGSGRKVPGKHGKGDNEVKHVKGRPNEVHLPPVLDVIVRHLLQRPRFHEC